MRASAIVLALLSLLPAAAVDAGEIADAAAAVEAAIAAEDFDAWRAANAVIEEKLWAAPGLHFGTLMLVTGPAAGFGSYDPRPDNIYTMGEPVQIYAEPAGYGYGDLGNGMLEVAFDIDLTISDPAGAVLGEFPGIMSLVYPSRVKAREFLANLTYNLDGVPPGDYTLTTNFRDRHSGQAASFTSEIVVK